jgi:hypothetical protein
MFIHPQRAIIKMSTPAHKITQVVSIPQKINTRPIAKKKGQYVGSGSVSGCAFCQPCPGSITLLSDSISLVNYVNALDYYTNFPAHEQTIALIDKGSPKGK